MGKLNVDENPEVASQYGIRSIPTVAVFHKGKPVQGFVGLTQGAVMKQALAGVGAKL